MLLLQLMSIAMLITAGISLRDVNEFKENRIDCNVDDCTQLRRTMRNTISLLVVATLVMLRELLVILLRFLNFNFISTFSTAFFLVVSVHASLSIACSNSSIVTMCYGQSSQRLLTSFLVQDLFMISAFATFILIAGIISSVQLLNVSGPALIALTVSLHFSSSTSSSS